RLAEIEGRLAFLVAAKQSAADRDRALAEASALIDALVRDIDAAATRLSASGSAFRPPDRRADQLTARAAIESQSQATGDPSSAADHLRRLEGQFGALIAELAGAIHEISDRQRAMDERAEA